MNVKRGYADGPFGQIHYQTAGEGIPLVLWHQSVTSSVQFQKAYRLLAERGINAIGMDMPGYGMSDRPDHPPTVAEYASVIPPLLDHFNLSSSNLLGHHTGSMVVTEAALAYPGNVDKVIHNGPVPFTREESRQFVDNNLAREKAWKIKPDGSHLQDLWNSRADATPGWTDLEAMNRQVVHALLQAEHYWYAHGAVFAYDQIAAFERITHSSLILTNTGDGIYFLAQRARELRPDFAYVELEGGTHDYVDEHPESWSDAVAEFLKR